MIALSLVLAIVAALVVHEAGHLGAALLLGGRDVRLLRRRMTFAVSALLASRRAEVLFLLSGAVANAVAGIVLFTVDKPLFGLLQFACALVNLAPHGTSDGARLRQRHLSSRLRAGASE